MTRSALLFLALTFLAASASGQASFFLEPPEPSVGARFGASLSMSTCGSAETPLYLMVGAPYGHYGESTQEAGKAYVYINPEERNARRLLSPDPSPGDLFGYSTYRHCWEFGGYLVGAPGADAAYHFHQSTFAEEGYVTELDGSVLGSGSGFGYATTALGAYLSVGAPFAEGGGAVLIFPEYGGPSAPDSASPRITLSPSHPDDSRFGAALAAGEASNGYLIVVGAPGSGTSPGAVYIYYTDGNGGLEEGIRLEGPPLFGTKVALPRGATSGVLAVTAPRQGEEPGRVYLYSESEDGWVPTDTLHAGAEAPMHFGRALWQGQPGIVLVGSPGSPDDPPQLLLAARYHTEPSVTDWVDVRIHQRSGEYGWAVQAISNGRKWAVSDPLAGGQGVVAIGTTADIFPELPPVSIELGTLDVSQLQISSIAPNPASSTADVSFDLGVVGPVRVTVFDLLGREVMVAFEDTLLQGEHTLPLEVASLVPGTYVLHMRAAGTMTTRLFTVLR